MKISILPAIVAVLISSNAFAVLCSDLAVVAAKAVYTANPNAARVKSTAVKDVTNTLGPNDPEKAYEVEINGSTIYGVEVSYHSDDASPGVPAIPVCNEIDAVMSKDLLNQ